MTMSISQASTLSFRTPAQPRTMPAAYPAWETTGNSAIDGAIQAARLGDDRAFAHLIDLYRSAAERLAQQILHTEEAAADAVQEAMIKAHRAMERFQEGNFRSWFLRIV
ncbi:MAG: hypothetical protein KDE24_23145, partial [Caldilinea sp.]|nr:hypothetical protein [Caldilinea sp.]